MIKLYLMSFIHLSVFDFFCVLKSSADNDLNFFPYFHINLHLCCQLEIISMKKNEYF